MTVLQGTGDRAEAATAARPGPSRGRRVLYSAAVRLVSSLGVLLMAAGLWKSGGAPSGWSGTVSQVAEAPGAGSEPALPRARPVRLTVPAIGVDAEDLVALDVDASGMLEAPEDADTVGWYGPGPWPGQSGPAVLGAHVDSLSGPAVFFRLRELEPGDAVTVARADGTEAVFSVYEVREYDKDAFPTDRVYGSTDNRAELRLVTCGGEFEHGGGGYTSNVVAYAVLEPPV